MRFLTTLTLRQILALDAVSSGAMGLLLFAGAGLLEPWLGVPIGVQRAAAAILLPFAAFVGWLASREAPNRALVWAVAAVNVVWAAESVLTLAGGWITPTALGTAFVIAQAVVVALLAELQILGLRRNRHVSA